MQSKDFSGGVNRGDAHVTAADGVGEEAGGGAPLVNLTKSSAAQNTKNPATARVCGQKDRRESRRETIDSETGEILLTRVDEKSRDLVQVQDEAIARDEARSGRFMLQRASARLLKDVKNPKEKTWRVTGCTWRRIADDVRVMHAPAINRSHYANLQICGSVWTCPVCAAKVSERRKMEIVQASDTHVAAGGGLYMVTFTFSHSRQDNLKRLILGLRQALTTMRKQRAYKRLTQYVDFVGLIRALEVTHGEENGWHPHVHELWLTSAKLGREALRILQRDLFGVWRDACSRAGIAAPNRKRGVTVQEAFSAQEYVTKFGRETNWGTGSELTKAHVKQGRAKGRTPFDLLRLFGEGDSRAGDLFKDFAQAFYGARQLFWSPGLKAAFGIDEKSDEELAIEQNEPAVEVCAIDKLTWRAVLAQSYDVRGLILSLAESGGAAAVELYLAGIRPVVRGGVGGLPGGLGG